MSSILIRADFDAPYRPQPLTSRSPLIRSLVQMSENQKNACERTQDSDTSESKMLTAVAYSLMCANEFITNYALNLVSDIRAAPLLYRHEIKQHCMQVNQSMQRYNHLVGSVCDDSDELLDMLDKIAADYTDYIGDDLHNLECLICSDLIDAGMTYSSQYASVIVLDLLLTLREDIFSRFCQDYFELSPEIHRLDYLNLSELHNRVRLLASAFNRLNHDADCDLRTQKNLFYYEKVGAAMSNLKEISRIVNEA